LTRVYRILRKPYSKNPFDGEGSYRFGGRWSSPGVRLVYTSEHLSLAMLEYFVHIDANDPPRDLVMAAADIPDGVSRQTLAVKHLPSDWRNTPAPPTLADLGDTFARNSRAAVLIAPSTIVPTESNWIINPLHPEFRHVRIQPVEAFVYDPRLSA
jgi:RES domain-containing protein